MPSSGGHREAQERPEGGRVGGKVASGRVGATLSSSSSEAGEFQGLKAWGWSRVAVSTSPARDPDRPRALPTTTSLLQTLSTQFRLAPGRRPDGRPWTYHLVQFADILLNHSAMWLH